MTHSDIIFPNARRPTPTPRHTTLTPAKAATAAFCCLVWSASFVSGKAAIGTADAPGFGPFRMAFLRFALCGVLLVSWRLWRDPDSLRIARKDRGTLFLLALFTICLTYSINYSGLSLSTGTAASLIMPTEPLWVALLAAIFLRERLTPPRIVGILCGLAGTILVVLSTRKPDAAGVAGNGALIGNLLIVFSLLFESTGVLIAKRLTATYKGPAIISLTFVLGAMMLFPFALYENVQHGWPHPTPAAWAGFLYLVGPSALLGYSLWYLLLETTDASELTVFIFIQPVFGTLLGVLWKGDPFNGYTLLGAALTLTGMAALLWQGIRRPRRLPETSRHTVQ